MRHLSDSFGITHYLEVIQGQRDQRFQQKLSLLNVLILRQYHRTCALKDMATLWWSVCTAGWGCPHWGRTVRWAPWRRRGAVGGAGPCCGRGRASSHDQTAAVLPPPALLPTWKNQNKTNKILCVKYNIIKISSTRVQHKVGSRAEMRWSPDIVGQWIARVPDAPSQGLMKWNEMDEMSVEKWCNEICDRGKREKPREKPTQTPFRPPRNPHGVTETRTRDPSGGRWAPNRLRHEAALLFILPQFI